MADKGLIYKGKKPVYWSLQVNLHQQKQKSNITINVQHQLTFGDVKDDKRC